MAFRFAEAFGSTYEAQRAEIKRLSDIGRLRKNAVLKMRALRMIDITLSGKPHRAEPERIARVLNVSIPTVRGWIEDFQVSVARLVQRGQVKPVQAWALLKKPSAWAAVERGIKRSKAARHAGAQPRRRAGRDSAGY